MQQLANAIQAHLDTLVDQYDARLQTRPGYVNFPATTRRDLERQILSLVAKCLTVGDSQELVHYVRQRAAHWAAAGLEIAWFQAALIVPEEILAPLIESVEASTFLWQALNRSQAAVWQLVAERLQQSEERFRRFSAATEEGLLFHEQGKILDVNPATLALFGYSAVSEIVGRNLLEFIVSESRALVLQKMQLDDVHPYEVECIRKDGSVFPVETSTRAYQHGEKTVRASSVRDITGRKRAEENLRNSEERLRAIYEGTSDAVMLLNEQGFFDCNPRTLEMFGFTTREEFTAVHPANVSPPHQPDGQESLQAAQEHIQAAYRQGYDRFEWIHRRTNGEDFPAEVLLSAVGIGKQRVLQATVRDITERKRAEDALRQSQQLLQAVMDNIPQAVFWKDRNLAYLGCNLAFAEDAGLASPTEIAGKTDYDMPWQAQADLYRADDQLVVESSTAKINYEEPQTTPTGEQTWLRTSKVPMRDTAGNVTAVLGMYEDITQRKRLEQSIRDSLERRSRQVEISRQVAQEIAAAPELSDLFQRVVTLTKERFNYYHAQIFRYDPAKEAVVLVEGYGETGHKMLEAGHQLPMGHGVVGKAAETGQSILAADVTQDPDWQVNPNLPGTKSELAVPIKLRDVVLGILDVQSEQAGALTDDDRLLIEGLCGQIATAMEGTRLLNELRSNEAQLSQALQIAKLAYWEYDVEKDLFLFNDQFYAIFHTTAEQHGGYQLPSAYYAQHFVHPDDLPVVGSEIEKALNSTDRHYTRLLEHRILYGDGGVGYIAVNINIDRDEQGHILRYYGANQDITERKQAEAALRASEEKYRDLIDGMNDTICVIDFDTTIVDVNNAATRVLGYTRDELLSMKIPDIDANLAPDQIQNLAGSMPRDKVQVFETWHKTKTGERLPVEVSSSLVSYGGQTVILSIARDITERKRTEVELKETEERFRIIAETTPVPILISSAADGSVLYGNDQLGQMFGIPIAELIGRPTPDFYVDPADRQVLLTQLRQTGALRDYELHVKRADGTPFWVLVSMRTLMFAGQRALFAAFIDITASRQAAEDLRRSEAQLSEALKTARLAYWELDLARQKFIFNDQLYALLHTTAEAEGGYEMDVNAYVGRFIYPEDIPYVGAMIAQGLQNPDPTVSTQLEARVVCADGEVRWLATQVSNKVNEAGQPKAVGTNQDITERKQAEAEREQLMAQQQKRALQLQTAAEVSRATSSILSLDELLPQSAELVRARFNLYYVGIFLTDEAERWAVLRAGTGDAAQQMLDKGHKLKIGAASMISQCITQQQARIALDVGEEAVRFDNPLLPLTRSELALPLISRGRVIGAVTIQSDQSAAFTPDDVTVLQTMADQIGNAIENARLYEQSMATLQEVDALNRRLTGEGWETYLRRGSNQQVIWASDDETIAPTALAAADEQLSAGQIVVEPAADDAQETVVSVPVMLRGQAIGALRIAMPEAAYTDELRATLESLAGHVAQAAENARLLDETQARFARERALGAATDKMRSRSEVEQILQTAAEELAHYLQASAIKVHLGSSVTAAGETA